MKKYMVAALVAACCAVGSSAALASASGTGSENGLASWERSQYPIAAPANDHPGNRRVAGIRRPGLVTISVPEPATWAMMFVGLGMIGLATRRRRDMGAPLD